jgi:hypothetical protein
VKASVPIPVFSGESVLVRMPWLSVAKCTAMISGWGIDAQCICVVSLLGIVGDITTVNRCGSSFGCPRCICVGSALLGIPGILVIL